MGRFKRWLKGFFQPEKLAPEPQCQPPFWTLQMVYLARAYYIVAELGIADLLKDGPLSCAELAQTTGTHEKSLFRILRALASFGVFAQNKAGQFVMTEQALGLRSDVIGSIRDWTILMGSIPLWEVYGQALNVVRTGRNGFELAHGELGDLYQYSEKHPDTGHTFIRAMSSWTQWQCDAILETYDFSRFRRLVDLGGGQATLMTGILLKYPQTRGVVFDQSNPIKSAKTLISEAGVEDRCELIVGSFFQDLPSEGDAYVLKHVLRDWDDERVIKILKNCYVAMPPKAKLIVIDATLDPDNLKDRISKLIDLEQLFWLNGRLRTMVEWDDLLELCGFHITGLYPTTIVDTVVLEAEKAR